MSLVALEENGERYTWDTSDGTVSAALDAGPGPQMRAKQLEVELSNPVNMGFALRLCVEAVISDARRLSNALLIADLSNKGLQHLLEK